MNNRGEIRITEDMLEDLGFKKHPINDPIEGKTFIWGLNITAETEDFYLITNTPESKNYPAVRFNFTDTYEFLYVEPIIVLLNILQSNCTFEDFKIN